MKNNATGSPQPDSASSEHKTAKPGATPATLVIELRQQLITELKRHKVLSVATDPTLAANLLTDLLTAFATTLAAVTPPAEPDTADDVDMGDLPHTLPDYYFKGVCDTQAPLTALIQEMRHGD